MNALIAAFALARAPAAVAADLGAGRRIFQARCAICHGPTGKDLIGADVREARPEDLAKIVSQGRNRMPAFKDKLTAAEIADVSAYVKSLGQPK